MLINILKAAVYAYLAYYTKLVMSFTISGLEWYNKLYLSLIALVILLFIEGIIKATQKYKKGH